MTSQDKIQRKKNDHGPGSGSVEPSPKPARPGPIKRFLDWIAKGAEESGLQKPTCSA